jgi:hypothetical protein
MAQKMEQVVKRSIRRQILLFIDSAVGYIYFIEYCLDKTFVPNTVL